MTCSTQPTRNKLRLIAVISQDTALQEYILYDLGETYDQAVEHLAVSQWGEEVDFTSEMAASDLREVAFRWNGVVSDIFYPNRDVGDFFDLEEDEAHETAFLARERLLQNKDELSGHLQEAMELRDALASGANREQLIFFLEDRIKEHADHMNPVLSGRMKEAQIILADLESGDAGDDLSTYIYDRIQQQLDLCRCQAV